MDRFDILLEGYRSGSLSQKELLELLELLGNDNPVLEEKVFADLKERAFDGFSSTTQRARILLNIRKRMMKKMQDGPIPPMRLLAGHKRWIAAAAILILIVTTAVIVIVRVNTNRNREIVQQQLKNDVAPGGNKAILTLANGQQVMLDSADIGTLARQGAASISKADSGKLTYSALREKPSEILYNTVATPKGGQYQLVLADGTKVWLNAASSIRFPVLFAENERRVEITGEVYFEVSKNAFKPFKVIISSSVSVKNRGEIEVLGTHFNINAYDDEATINTTLLEGSVKVSLPASGKIAGINNKGAGVVIKPRQQAQLLGPITQQQIKIIDSVDTDEVMAWKNGKFSFNGTNIKAVMRQASRWYDVDIVYEGNTDNIDFSGGVSRKEYISQLLKVLEATGTVHFRIESRKVTVMP